MFIRRKVIMATSKDTKKEAVETTEVKETVKKAPAKKAAAKKETVKKETTKKETAKTEEKKTATKKASTKKADETKTETAKAPAKKPAAKKPAMKVNMHVQFAYKDYEAETIYELAINDYVAAGNKKSSIKNLVAYVKAEDNKVYYVINDEYKGEVGL